MKRILIILSCILSFYSCSSNRSEEILDGRFLYENLTYAIVIPYSTVYDWNEKGTYIMATDKRYAWLYDSEGWNTYTENYPISYTYKVSPKHPELRVIDNNAYNEKGDLVVARETWEKDAMHAAAILYYRECLADNKWGIKSDKETYNALKIILGITESEEDILSNNFNLLVSCTNYLQQCLKESKDLAFVYEFKRVNDTEFDCVFLNTEGNASRTLRVSFYTNEPFKAQAEYRFIKNSEEISVPNLRVGEKCLSLLETRFDKYCQYTGGISQLYTDIMRGIANKRDRINYRKDNIYFSAAFDSLKKAHGIYLDYHYTNKTYTVIYENGKTFTTEPLPERGGWEIACNKVIERHQKEYDLIYSHFVNKAAVQLSRDYTVKMNIEDGIINVEFVGVYNQEKEFFPIVEEYAKKIKIKNPDNIIFLNLDGFLMNENAEWSQTIMTNTTQENIEKNVEENQNISSSTSVQEEDENSFMCTRQLTEDDLAGKTSDELRLMRNYIYARHGYRFTKEDLLNHFSQYSWYEPHTDDVSAIYNEMSETERYNVNFIKGHE